MTCFPVIVITKDEEASIARTLRLGRIGPTRSSSSIRAARDRTVEIARELGAKVTVTPDWPGFGPQKNRAL